MEDKNKSSGRKAGRPQKDKVKRQYTISMDEDFHNQVQEAANKIGISFSAYISIALDQYMRDKR